MIKFIKLTSGQDTWRESVYVRADSIKCLKSNGTGSTQVVLNDGIACIYVNESPEAIIKFLKDVITVERMEV